MTKNTTIHTLLGAALLFSLNACGDDGEGTTGTDSNTTSTTSTTSTSGSTTDNPTSTTDNPTSTTENPTTEPMTSGSTGTPGGGFVFAPDPPEAYTQIDRHGAVEAGTAGIGAPLGLGLGGEDLSIRNMYNASNPVEDAAGMWVPEIGKSVTFFHQAFDDDLMALGLVPATVDETVMQAGPVIIPDTIKYDPTMPTSYPNGRKLEDPVVDITLAAVLIKLGPMQPLDLFASLPLNPPANDVPFQAEFPFLAPPHMP